jgi:hypothetical protein
MDYTGFTDILGVFVAYPDPCGLAAPPKKRSGYGLPLTLSMDLMVWDSGVEIRVVSSPSPPPSPLGRGSVADRRHASGRVRSYNAR